MTAATSQIIMRTEGASIVTDIVSIFSYELVSGLEKARELKIRLHPLCTLSDLLDFALDHERITTKQSDMIADFSKDPEGWAAKYGK